MTMLDLSADLSFFFADWGQTATLIDSSTVTVVLNNAGEAMQLLTGEVEITGPTATIRTSELGSITRGTQLTIAGTIYIVSDAPRQTDNGLHVLTLTKKT